MEARKGEEMKELVVLVVIYAAVAMLGGGGLLVAQALTKEPTTLEEATTRKHSDRNIIVFEDAKHGYVCYYRKSSHGLSCVPYPYR